MFQPVPKDKTVHNVEEEQLLFWREKDVLKRTMTERADGPNYVFYEGPPTANGLPGSHHVLSRAFKDIFPRYKTMRGHYVLRKAGWDTHGLPVEIAVEKELGIEHKWQIEEYGIAEFNAKCRESVLRHIDEWEKLTERIAFWVDTDQAYYTFTSDFVQSVWHILKQFHDRDLLFQGHKVVPYCPRCGTALSSHEVNLGYSETKDPSFYIRFKVADEADTYFLVWTTTPWTLPGNVALAVGEDLDYVKLKGANEHGETEYLYAAAAMVESRDAAASKHGTHNDEEGEAEDTARPSVLERLKSYEIVERLKGADLMGRHYEPLFPYLETDKKFAYVTSGDFVSVADGTGIVHMAPAFGADDLEVGRANDLPMFMTINEEGRFVEQVTDFAGQWVKDADPEIVKNLNGRGLAFAAGKYLHRYPFCWRCDTPLLYYARPTWFIATSKYREDMTRLNDTIGWVPGHIRDGRFGNWLEGNIDWALGRERYWGTPLPIWLCDNPECDHQHAIGGLAELGEMAGDDLMELDPHRPYVDDVTWACTECGTGTMHRVPEVIDVWFDSGSMPFAQWGYPHEHQGEFKAQYPADYICEAIDQTRGWFYSLHAISTLLNDSVAFRNVICLGHILDENGEKMSKSKGNVVNPWDVIDQYGSDMFRWYMFTAGPPGESRRFSIDLVGEAFRKFWLTLWNTYRFFIDYANLDGFKPAEHDIPVAERPLLDRWVLAELNSLVEGVTNSLETYDVTGATRPIEAFMDDLSNWYVRRSRRRFWKSESDTDKVAAYLTLYECLVTLSKLLAPSMPFMAEELYRNLVGSIDPDAAESVHLAEWPDVNAALIDEKLLADMRLTKRLASLGHAVRNSTQVNLRQPLAEAAFGVPSGQAPVIEAYAGLLADELNVKDVVLLSADEGAIEYALNPLPKMLGPKLGKNFPVVQKILREGDVEVYAKTLLNGDSISVDLNGESIVLTPEEVEVRFTAGEGRSVAQEGGYVVALDTRLTPDLEAEGLAREVVRRIQVLRRDAGFDIDDHIETTYTASERLAAAIAQFSDLITTETLSESLSMSTPTGETAEHEFDGEILAVGITKA